MDPPQPPPPSTNMLSPDEQAGIAERLGTPVPGRDPGAGNSSVSTSDAVTAAQTAPCHPPFPAIPGYEILSELGRGGMGVVYQARHLKLNRLVALKMILTGAYAGTAELARFQREAEALARLQHPNIVQIYEIGEHEGHPFLSLEFVDGGSLLARLAGASQPGRGAARTVEVLARAIHYAHQRGIIHRDLKPANILLQSEVHDPAAPDPASATAAAATQQWLPATLKITDFGLAKQVDASLAQTHSGAIMGTPMYMAPEQAAGQIRLIGPRTDVYALGVILYEMLTGRVPFRGPTPLDTLEQVRSRDPVPPSRVQMRVHRDLETICLKALSKEPDRRYASALALADDLARFQAGDAIMARREGIGRKLWRKVRRQPIRFGAAPALLLALVVAFYFAWHAYRTSRDTALQQTFRDGMEVTEWTPQYLIDMEASLADWERLLPELAPDARSRLYRRFGDYVQQSYSHTKLPSPELADIERIRSLLDALESRDQNRAEALRAGFQQRLAEQKNVLDVAATSPPEPSDFPEVDVVGSALFRRTRAGTSLPPRYLTRIACRGDVRLAATFDSTWEQAAQIGLLLFADDQHGFEFLLGAARERSPLGKPPAPSSATSIKDIKQQGGALRLQILQHGRLLRERMIPAGSLAEGPLRLEARWSRGLLVCYVNGQEPPLRFHTAFAPRSQETGLFGLHWPAGVGLQSLQGFCQALPANPSPLERGDAFYDEARYDDALATYRQQDHTADASRIATELTYKEALCLIKLRRFEEAAAILEPLKTNAEPQFALPGTLQLTLIRLRQNQLLEAAALLQFLATPAASRLPDEDGPFFGFLEPGKRLEQLAALVPEDDIDELCRTFEARYLGYNFLFFDIAQMQQALEILLSVSDRLPLKTRYRILMKLALTYVYWYDSDRQPEFKTKAAKLAADILDRHGKDVEETDLFLVPIILYCDLSMANGQAAEAIPRIDTYLQRNLEEYQSLWVDRARLHVAERQFAEADRDLDRLLATATPLPYSTYSDAWLVRGFLREREGKADEALAAWRQGLYKVYVRSPWNKPTVGPFAPAALAGALRGLILASLADEFSDADYAELLRLLDPFFPNATAAGVVLAGAQKAFGADVHRPIYRRPKGHQFARQLAFHEFSLRDAIRQPMLLTAMEAMRFAFPGHELTADQEKVLSELAGAGLDFYLSGKVSFAEALTSHGVPLVATWNDDAGPVMVFGPRGIEAWKTVEGKLDPKLRGGVAYLFGCKYRYVHRKPQEAALLLRTAVASAPSGSLLQRLAQAELDAATSQPGPQER